jgi:hypothetical protein
MPYTLFVTILLKPCNCIIYFIIKKWFYYMLIKLVLTGVFFLILSLKPVELCTNCINDGGFYIIKTSLTMYNETGLTLYYVPMNWILMQENIKKYYPQLFIYNFLYSSVYYVDLIVGVLTPLSTIFQLYHGHQFIIIFKYFVWQDFLSCFFFN